MIEDKFRYADTKLNALETGQREIMSKIQQMIE